MKDRIKAIRKELGLTQEKFADRLGVKRNTIATYEIGRNEPIDAVISLICREFNVNEEWLRTGEGEMFRQLPEEEEVASLVSELLEDGEDNPLYGVILEIMRTYNELSPESQRVLREASKKLLDNLRKRKEG